MVDGQVAAGLSMPSRPGPTPAGIAADWLVRSARRVHERRTWLTELDAAIGDGDHGINLDRGLSAVLADLEAGRMPGDDAGRLLAAAGRRLLGLVGGASGALYGRALMTAGARLTERAAGEPLDPRSMAETALGGAVDAIAALGRAAAGDKTMLDALLPALAAIRAALPDEPAAAVIGRAAVAAEVGARSTIPLVARKGRASYLGERSAGHEDPGAASSAMLVRCLADAVAAATRSGRGASAATDEGDNEGAVA
jgi:dihydroxyacetone kinase-like protein